MNEKFCPFCEAEHDNQKFFWRKVPVYEQNSTKLTAEAVAISCVACGRIISVIPSNLFPQAQD